MQRTPEIGIRMALGAACRDVLRLVVAQAMRLAVLGVGLGAGLALATGRVIEGLLFGIEPGDPVTFTAVCAGVLLVALVACALPALRATRINPIVALRAE